jgi:hypothetical protein
MEQSPSWEANSYSRISSHYMEPKVLLPHSQQPATCPYPEPDKSSPDLLIPLFARPILYYYFLIYTRFFHVLSFPLVFPPKTLCASLLSPVRATWPVCHTFRDFIIRIMFAEECRAQSCSLRSLSNSSLTSSLLGPIIFLSTLFSKHDC